MDQRNSRFHGRGIFRETEADLGMFSMFGRTGAPRKRRPHKKKQKIVR